jgi:hypothetical protein
MHWDQKVISLQYTVGIGKASQKLAAIGILLFVFFLFLFHSGTAQNKHDGEAIMHASFIR